MHFANIGQKRDGGLKTVTGRAGAGESRSQNRNV